MVRPVPSSTMGMTGTLAATARRNAPSLNGWTSPSRERVPSGKSSTGTPRFSQRSHVAIILPMLSLSPRTSFT